MSPTNEGRPPASAKTAQTALPLRHAARRLSYLSPRDLPDSPTVKQLCRWVAPIRENMRCSDVFNRLIEDPSLFVLPVVDANEVPCALVERHAYVEYFSRQFVLEIHGKKTLAAIGETETAINKRPVVADAATSIDDVARIIIDAGMQHMVTGFIVTEGERYLGVANGHDLLQDITERKQEELFYLAHYDSLTRLPNRLLMADRLTMACRESIRNGTLVGLLFVDLDRFKQINDTLGHRFGDHLLQAVAERLEACLRAIDTVSRLGGDEFAILLEHLKEAGDVDLLVQRIVDALHQPFHVLEREIVVTASIGVAIYPRDDVNVESLFAKADAAMYDAKKSGRNAFRKYVPGLSASSMEHFVLEADLRRALERNELLLHYQPQISVPTGAVVGIEALLRWRHPSRGMVSPAVFIPIAEESGLIVDIGTWVLRQACRQSQAWSQDRCPPLRMAVNISAVQFRCANFVEVVRNTIEAAGIDPGCVELELTEGIAMQRAPDVLDTLLKLKQLGVRLAIDDFGTGFSSLSYLQRFPIDSLKIDQSFIRGVDAMPANRSIVQAIVAMSKSLALELIAEGVETESEFDFARACACDRVQGYFHCRPVPAEEFVAWLGARSPAPSLVGQ